MPRFSGSSPCFVDHVLRHPHLDPEQEVGVLGERHRAGFGLCDVDIVQLGGRERRQAVIGDMDEGVHARPRLGHDEPAQRRQIVDPGIACRDDGRRGLELHQLVGGNPDGRAVRVDVTMQIDETGHHELACRVDALQRALGGDRLLHRLDDAPADADIASGTQRLAGVEHLAAADHQIVLVGRPHRSPHRRGEADGCSGCGKCQEIAA